MSRNPSPTGRTYKSRSGHTYHQMSNGQYAYDNGGLWLFVTYAMLFQLVDPPVQKTLTSDHQAWVASNGTPDDQPAHPQNVVYNTGGGGNNDIVHTTDTPTDNGTGTGGGSSCSSGSSCGSSCGGGGCGG